MLCAVLCIRTSIRHDLLFALLVGRLMTPLDGNIQDSLSGSGLVHSEYQSVCRQDS